MGLFCGYTSNLFAGLNKTPTTILETSTNGIPHVIAVNSVIICNITGQPIRLNLQKMRTDTNSTTVFYVKDFEVPAYSSVDLLNQKYDERPLEKLINNKTLLAEIQIYLYYTLTPLVTDKLICFSNTVAQTFDCEVSYTILKETPIIS
jgi:hypothetical protein